MINQHQSLKHRWFNDKYIKVLNRVGLIDKYIKHLNRGGILINTSKS